MMMSIPMLLLLCLVAVSHGGTIRKTRQTTAEQGLTDAQIALFEATGQVTITDVNARLWKFGSTGVPSDQTVVDQFESSRFSVSQQDYSLRIRKFPVVLDSGSEACLPMGKIGMAIDGVAFYNPYSLDGYDAVETETFGKCNGHPDPSGAYHHHAINNCTYTGAADQLLGVALDGYPILGANTHDSNGDLITLTSSDLDICHGESTYGTSDYKYRITNDFPYILSCFHASPLNVNLSGKNCRIADVQNPGSDASYGWEARMLVALKQARELDVEEETIMKAEQTLRELKLDIAEKKTKSKGDVRRLLQEMMMKAGKR